MNVTDFTYLLQHPSEVISPAQTGQLEDVLKEYPYFQAARAVHLKGLKNTNSFKYNNALKITAAYTSDRDILFDFITSEEFLQNSIADTISGRTSPLVETETIAEVVAAEPTIKTNLIEREGDGPLPQNLKDAEQILNPKLFTSKDPNVDKEIAKAKKKAEEKLGLGRPLNFTKKEKYSFGQWLQLTAAKSINREDGEFDPVNEKKHKDIVDRPTGEERLLKKKKFELIDKFIEQNPKIIPQEKFTSTIALKDSNKLDKNELMTETLAKVYLEQKNYKKAIQSYTILSLKYPEKSGFFADRIKAIEKIQQKNA